ncbi:MAG: T9SS type A sorting domain-containing protein [Bacteroidales bacterium]|nr:T9SS type A sorting domain-containing protein [Bacteroidales bacterium]
MKVKFLLAGTFLLGGAGVLFSQEIMFPLYFESLANGKKDTLWLGFSDDGKENCDFDSTLNLPHPYPIGDTVDRMGAFIVATSFYDFEVDPDSFTQPVTPDSIKITCLNFLKRRISLQANNLQYDDINIVFPSSTMPVKLWWDSAFLRNYHRKIIMTDWPTSTRYDVSPYMGGCLLFYMENHSSYTFDTNCKRNWDIPDSHFFLDDATQGRHRYQLLFIHSWTRTMLNNKEHTSVSAMIPCVRITPNPIGDIFIWKSDISLKKWSISDISGKIVFRGNAEQKEISSVIWPAGIYIFGYVTEKGDKGSIKFIKR